MQTLGILHVYIVINIPKLIYAEYVNEISL